MRPPDPNPELRVAVVVPTFRRPDDLRRCLGGLSAQTRPADEVLVVTREEDAETRQALSSQDMPLEVRRVDVLEAGVVAALTAGLDAVRADVVAITDDDAVPAPDWLARIERHFRSDATVAAVGGRDRVHEAGRVLNGARHEVGRVRWYGRVIGNHHLGVGGPRAVELLKGVNMSFRVTALGALRPDARLLGRGAQVHFELGLCLALARRGWKIVYDPAVTVDHYPACRFDDDQRGAPSFGALCDAAHNELYLLMRWLPAWRKPFALGYAFLVGGSRASPGILIVGVRLVRGSDAAALVRRFLAAQRGRLRAIATICGWHREAAL
jgi:cellulose synthase/poly-beta-1,6-N-acetylglucosamine synthase-like glycosyltransferase